MKKVRVFMVLALLTSMMGNSVYASEITGSGTGSSDAVLNTEAAAFSVTVPMGLPIYVDGDGYVTVSDEAKIVNNSYGAVKVTNVDIEGSNGWSVIDYDSDLKSLKVGAKEFGFLLNGGQTVDGVLEFDEANYPVMAGANATDSDELPLIYNALVAPQNVSLADEKIADVVFTIDWDGTDEDDIPDFPEEQEQGELPTTFAGIYGHMGEDIVNALETGEITVEAENMFQFDSITGTITGTTLNKTSEFTLVIPSEINEVPVKHIGKTAFPYTVNQQIKELVIPYGVETIGESAFSSLTKITSLIIPDSVKAIEKRAFMSKLPNITSLRLSENLIKIGEESFVGFTGLKELRIPDSVKTIEDGAFYAKDVLVGANFGGLSSLENIYLGESITHIGYRAFMRMGYASGKINELVIPDSVIAIEKSAFAETKFDTVTIGSSVTTIEKGTETVSGGANMGIFQSNQALTTIINKSSLTINDLVQAQLMGLLSDGKQTLRGSGTSTTGTLSRYYGSSVTGQIQVVSE